MIGIRNGRETMVPLPFHRELAGEQTINGSYILVAAGRSPNTAGIGLELALS